MKKKMAGERASVRNRSAAHGGVSVHRVHVVSPGFEARRNSSEVPGVRKHCRRCQHLSPEKNTRRRNFQAHAGEEPQSPEFRRRIGSPLTRVRF
ncbi:uncharacterized protein LOC110882602 isoform X2 [Helianthus annuus]|uniref:uncharacterized protein LOC110882601 isoform X2 n=1 Tax=Helianthus annuus TaxID=4232 RepID=UPI000B8FDCB1|nr:uncharacterized protein LOC110882601 isoform X2 [Helianthus annuus]XP_021986279.1 uncharacterized protein LOC110882602 isoform X2 [Helianthus annuus]